MQMHKNLKKYLKFPTRKINIQSQILELPKGNLLLFPKPPILVTKKETLLKVSCISKNLLSINPIVWENTQPKAAEGSVQQGFHCSCCARNENLAIVRRQNNLSVYIVLFGITLSRDNEITKFII